jgi:hypothetical protein
MLAGLPVPNEAAHDLASRLRDEGVLDTAEKLEEALAHGAQVAALSIDDREAILRVLDEAPEGLAELRAVLFEEHVERVREGINPLDDAGA